MPSASPTISSDPLRGCFAARAARGSAVLIPYITAGYPEPDATSALLAAVADAGADIIELGVPFSDPVADGPTIQRSSQRALEHGITLAWTLRALADFRRTHTTPVVIFGYLNPILSYGEAFIADALEAGAQGVLITDLPLGADEQFEQRLEQSPLALVRLLAPTTPPERARAIATRTQGFLYYVSRLGVTGARQALRGELAAELRQLRSWAAVPVAVGFGISTPQQARELRGAADGIVVGSALIDAIDRAGIGAAHDLISGMRAALDHD